MRKNIFSIGNTVDPAEGYRNFRGRDPKVEALIEGARIFVVALNATARDRIARAADHRSRRNPVAVKG